MLTEAGKYGKLYFAQSEKQSRVSTLTGAQIRDSWFIFQSIANISCSGFECLVDSLPIHFFIWRYDTISELMINEQIRDKEVRLIGPDGEQLGIMSAREAMAKAQEAELDLVKIAPQAKPPVCKIIDYGKYRYELARKEKEAKKKQKTIDVKEVRLSPNIDTNDLNTKAGAARKFLTKGDRVKVTLRFRGREMAHMSSSRHVLDDFADLLSDIATVEKAPKVEGRSMTMFLTEKR